MIRLSRCFRIYIEIAVVCFRSLINVVYERFLFARCLLIILEWDVLERMTVYAWLIEGLWFEVESMMVVKIETIEPYIRPPWWTSTTKTKIEITKNAMKNQHDRIQMHLNITMITIYTNDSNIKNKIDGIIYNSSTNEVYHQYLGCEI